MPLLDETNYVPTEKYARAKELLKHAEMIGQRYDLYRRTLFQTEVQALRWDETNARWTAETNRGDKIRATFAIPAAGPLHRPKLPGLSGIESYKGHSFHSSRWDYNYTGGDPSGGLEKLKDKRVGIIGTGATAVQIVPHVGQWAKQTVVFQRTPSSIDVRGNKPTDTEWVKTLGQGWQKKRMDNFNIIVNGGHQDEDLVSDGWTDILRELLVRPKDGDTASLEELAQRRQITDFKKMEQIRARVDRIVKDKKTAESLKPYYNQFCKRPCFHDEVSASFLPGHVSTYYLSNFLFRLITILMSRSPVSKLLPCMIRLLFAPTLANMDLQYLDTFNIPTVKLVDTQGKGVDAITEKGVVVNDEEYELDCIIYATGFELATDWTHRAGIEIWGRDGLTITEKWKTGASTLHGWATRSFPNCFFVSIVQAALTPNFIHITGEQANHLAYVVKTCRDRNIRTIEPTQEAEEAWVETILKMGALRAEFNKDCTPGYYNNEGKPSPVAARNASYGGGALSFIEILEKWRADDKLDGLEVVHQPVSTN